MRDAVGRILSKFRDAFESWLAKALLAAVFMVATLCLGSLSALYALDSGNTVTGCASVLFYGFCFGWLAKWVQVEHMPMRRLRKSIEALPPNQRALLHSAYAADGAFGREGDFSRRLAGDDLHALVALGHLREVKGGPRPAWQMEDSRRRLLDGDAGIRRSLECEHSEWAARARDRVHREDVDAARRDIINLSEAGRKMLGDLTDAGGPVPVDRDTEQQLIHNVGMRLLEFTPTLGPGALVGLSDAAREAIVPARREVTPMGDSDDRE